MGAVPKFWHANIIKSCPRDERIHIVICTFPQVLGPRPDSSPPDNRARKWMRERERQTELCGFNIAKKSKARVKPEEQYQEKAKQAQRQIAPNNSKMQNKCKANTKAEKNANTNTKEIQGEKKCKKMQT